MRRGYSTTAITNAATVVSTVTSATVPTTITNAKGIS